MEEVELAENVLQLALNIARRHGAKRIRVINLALYSEFVDCSELAFHLKLLAQDTMAAEALLNLNHRRPGGPKLTLAGQSRVVFSIESIELDSVPLADAAIDVRRGPI